MIKDRLNIYKMTNITGCGDGGLCKGNGNPNKCPKFSL